MAALGLKKFSDAEAYLLKGMSVVDRMGELKIRMLGIQRIDARLLRHLMSAKLGELYANQNRLKEADEQFKALPEKLTQVARDSLTFDYHARHYLEVVQKGAKFYTSQNNIPAAESFYKLVWPEDVRPVVRTIPVWPEENYKRSILALAPDSCVQQMIEILNSYNELLEKAQPTRNANIEFGLQRYMNGSSRQMLRHPWNLWMD